MALDVQMDLPLWKRGGLVAVSALFNSSRAKRVKRRADSGGLPRLVVALAILVVSSGFQAASADEWEITPASEQALHRGLRWLAANQGPHGNWTSDDLGLVSTGVLAFLAAGHLPDRGEYGGHVRRALDFVIRGADASGLLNIAEPRRGVYNHGLSTFVLGQAYGMTRDPRLGPTLDRALRLIADTQCEDGGWDYVAVRQRQGHDLSLAVMQALALRSAVDSGLDVPPGVIHAAIRSVREHYTPGNCPRDAPEEEQKRHHGQFTYARGGGNPSTAMAAAGVVCLQEFGQYDDWRIAKNVDVIRKAVREAASADRARRERRAPFDPYTLYYVAQALYQVGGEPWRECYPLLRDAVVASQVEDPNNSAQDGMWSAQGHVGGKPGDLYMTAVCCFVLAIPNRYLPILQEGRIETLERQFASPSP
ncbi:MAG: squalene--hopene cyclase [Thermogutta sp.]